MHKRTEGDETYHRLLNWTKGQKAAERLSGHILRVDGFEDLDPIHPLGGRDGLKDVIAVKDDLKFIGAAYFPSEKRSFTEIKNKFSDDFKGVKANNADAFVFCTNQKLTDGERKQLREIASPINAEIYHLERVTHILNTPRCYGVRLEFLDIEMSKEEQLSFLAELQKEQDDRLDAMSNDTRQIPEIRTSLDYLKSIVEAQDERSTRDDVSRKVGMLAERQKGRIPFVGGPHKGIRAFSPGALPETLYMPVDENLTPSDDQDPWGFAEYQWIISDDQLAYEFTTRISKKDSTNSTPIMYCSNEFLIHHLTRRPTFCGVVVVSMSGPIPKKGDTVGFATNYSDGDLLKFLSISLDALKQKILGKEQEK